MSDAPSNIAASIPVAMRAGVHERLEQAAAARVAERLHDGDGTLWGAPQTPEVANRLGWLTIAERMHAQLEELEAFSEEVRAAGFEHVLLLGMGGSSLAPEVLRRAFGAQPGRPTLHVLDSTDAATILAAQHAVDLQRTLFVVSSKSGGTIEPLSLFAHFFALHSDGSSFVAITDPGSGLEQLAAEHRFRRVFAGDPDIGGRYSALSPFGIVPAALSGIDVRALLEGAHHAWHGALEIGDAAAIDGAAVSTGVALGALARAGADKLTFLISDSLPGLGLWLEQLVAESTGKHGTGILPVADEPLGEPHVYGEDRVFAYLPDLSAPDAELEQRVHALAHAGHPVLTIPARGPHDLGRLFLLAEIAVAAAGWALDINPFDQPNVQQAKDATNEVLAGYESSGSLPVPADADDAALSALVFGGGPPEYVAIMAYLQPSPELDRAAAELREVIRARAQATTTFGYGPRFLHSTGQFHKGGPATGRFLQIVHDGPTDVDIPGAPYTFTTLKNAQAIGDLNTLRATGRPAARVRLSGEDPVSALRALTARIKEST